MSRKQTIKNNIEFQVLEDTFPRIVCDQEEYSSNIFKKVVCGTICPESRTFLPFHFLLVEIAFEDRKLYLLRIRETIQVIHAFMNYL